MQLEYQIVDQNNMWVPIPPDEIEEGQKFRCINHVSGDLKEGVWGGSRTDNKPTKITKLAFKYRMTQDERIALRNLAKTNDVVYDFLDLVDSAEYIDLSREDTKLGVMYLEDSGVLAAGRSSEILSTDISPKEIYNAGI